jgi:S-adenosylmethionine decarboxylase proenzyme
MTALGKHLLVDFHGCDPSLLDDVAHVQTAMETAAQAAAATVLQAHFHRFSPCGVTGVLTLRESHLAIHTWPEHGFAAVDLFTCGTIVDPWKARAALKTALGASSDQTREILRGDNLSSP